MKKSKTSLFLYTACFLIVGFITYSMLSGSGGKSAEKASYYTVKKSDLNISVTEDGVLKAVDEEVIKNRLNGQSLIISIVAEGSRVKKGDLLVELDPAEAKKQLQQIQLELETSKSALITAKNDLLIEKSTIESEQREARKQIEFANMDLKKFEELDKKQQIREAKSKITSEEESLRITEEKYGWSQKLAAKGFETKSQVDRDKLELSNRKKSLESAKSRLQMLEKFDLPKAQVELTSKVTEANKRYERLLKQGDSKLSRSQGKLAAAERKLTVNQTRLTENEEQLNHTKLYAPADGIVIYPPRSHRGMERIQEGAKVSKNRQLISIPSLQEMKVVIKVPEFHISKMKMGQTAYVSIESISDKRYKASISRVNPLPDKSNSWLGDEEKLYRVEMTITDPLPDVKPSISAKAEVIITDLKDVFYIPLHAIRSEKDKHYCYIKDGDDHRKAEIKIGLMNNSFAEITKGVSEGDQILLNIPDESE